METILKQFGIDTTEFEIKPIGNGLINHTWHIKSVSNDYILQKINTQVFKQPDIIDDNLKQLKFYLGKSYPEYIFAAPLKAENGSTLVCTEDGEYRIFDFVKNSVTILEVKTAKQAYEAAKQFGRFSRLLNNFDAEKLGVTIPNFHNLTLRYEQFKQALKNPDVSRLAKAKEAILDIEKHKAIVQTFEKIQSAQIDIPKRVIHHDTKISNVLFDENELGICVIDLDTVMPGYYISDVGDMMRSYLSLASEEEQDFSKISVRTAIFKAIYEGYFSEMGDILNDAEKSLFTYSGKFLIYMQALRFVTDYLNKDVYYGAKYQDHNLNRAINQLTLLKEYIKVSELFEV